MHTSYNVHELIDLLGRHLKQVKIMLDILQQENTALEKRDLSNFDAIVLRKQQQIRLLEEMEPDLTPIHALIGKPSEGNGMDSFISKIDNKSIKLQFQSLWNDLRETLTNCDNQNLINNRILQSSRINIQQAIDILRGENSIPNLYGSSGKQDMNKQGQSLAVA